jgi:hypothetical protein
MDNSCVKNDLRITSVGSEQSKKFYLKPRESIECHIYWITCKSSRGWNIKSKFGSDLPQTWIFIY